MLELAVGKRLRSLAPSQGNEVRVERSGRANVNAIVILVSEHRLPLDRGRHRTREHARSEARTVFAQNNEHADPMPVWGRFKMASRVDSYEWRETFSRVCQPCSHQAREWATHHFLSRRGSWWVWIISPAGSDVSAGIVYDNRIFKLPEGAKLGANGCMRTFSSNPVGHEIFGRARVIEGDVHALSMLPILQ